MGTVFTIASEDEFGGGEATVSGFLIEENPDVLKIVDSSGNELTVPAAKVIARKPMALSIMPEGLLDGMHEDRVRDLFAFLQD
jgi:putative heme-binding domain-containing protein